MDENILIALRTTLLERTSLDSLPKSVRKRSSALNTWGTNAIEGSTITFEDAKRIIIDNETPAGKSMDEVAETMQHERAFGSLTGRRQSEITLSTVQEFHADVFRLVKPDAGQWRRVNVRISGAKFTPPRMEKVLREMETWASAYRKRDIEGDDTFILGAWMHFEFERIHPFSDGNGRVGRLLLNLHFVRRNWPPVHILPAHKEAYIAGLNSAFEGDLKPLADLFKKLMASSLLDLLDQIGTSDDELISLGEASKILPHSRNYLALRCNQGELPSLKEKGQWRTSRRALELYGKWVGRA